MLPLTLAVVRLTFHGLERPMAMLVYTVVTAIAILVALVAVVIERLADWRATLILPVLVGTAGCYLAWRYVLEAQAQERVLRRASTAAAWSLIFLPLALGFIIARLTGAGTIRCRASRWW